MIEHEVVASAKDASHVLVGAWVQTDAESRNAIARLLLDGMLGVEDQIFAVVNVDVVRLAIGDQQNQFARGSAIAQKKPA